MSSGRREFLWEKMESDFPSIAGLSAFFLNVLKPSTLYKACWTHLGRVGYDEIRYLEATSTF